MKYSKNLRQHIALLILITLSIIIAYSGLSNSFFQQDEWQTLAANIYFLSKGATGIVESFLPTDPLSHFNPFARIFSWIEYFLYKTNFTFYAWQSIFLHILNVCLLYYFVLCWFKRKKIAFTAALFFGVNSIPHQAVTWVAAANSYEVPTLFILASLIFFQKFLDQKDKRKRNVIISLLALFISLLFHENGIFLFLFYPIIFFFFARARHKKLYKVFLTSVILTVVIFILIRIPFFFGFSSSIPAATDISQPSINIYPYRLISLTMKSFAGSFFSEKTLINISDRLIRLAYPQFVTSDGVSNPFISQSIVFDLVSYALTVIVVCMIVLLVLFMQQDTITKGLVWSLLFIPASLLPYGFVLGKAGYASILDPKFFYIASIGISILVALIVATLAQKFSKAKSLVTIIYILYGLYILFHVYSVKTYVDKLQTTSEKRRTLLTTITSSYKRLPQNVVFYTKSDTAYYGMPDNEKILPVQIGFGKMLMIWYQKDERYPTCLYEKNFLISLLDEGYKYCDGRGFGYFRNYDKLLATVGANRIKPEEVIAYSWEGKKGRFTDTTQDVRNKIDQEIKRINETNQ